MNPVIELFRGLTEDTYFLAINDKCLEINAKEFIFLKKVFDFYFGCIDYKKDFKKKNFNKRGKRKWNYL